MIVCAECENPVAEGARLCMSCGCDPTGKTVTARLSLNGNVLCTLERDERIVLGRKSEVSAVADRLNDFDDVSRVHAEVTLHDDGGVEILDCSKFGTCVNGELLGADTRRRFKLPVELRLGKHCLLRIEASR